MHITRWLLVICLVATIVACSEPDDAAESQVVESTVADTRASVSAAQPEDAAEAESDPTTADTGSSAEPSGPTSTEVATTIQTADSRSDVPLPDTTGDYWPHITQELRRFLAYMLENPDPDLVSHYAVEGSEPFDFYQQLLTDNAEGGIRGLSGAAGEIVWAELESGSTESGSVVLEVLWNDDGYAEVGPDGEVVFEEPPTGLGTYRWVLDGSVEDGWKVRELVFVAPYQPDSP